MANIIKKAVAGLLEKMLKPATVLAVREWDPAPVYEVEISYSGVLMENWTSVKRLKCKVGLLEFRDYTPACWEAEKGICTLFIEAGHQGAGSRWVRELKAGDEVLLDEAHGAHVPPGPGQVLGLGDGSAIGHFLALKKLLPEGSSLDAALFLNAAHSPDLLFSGKYPSFNFVSGTDRFEELRNWCAGRDLSVYSFIYLAGNIPMIKRLRTMLKQMVGPDVKIYAHGFWS